MAKYPTQALAALALLVAAFAATEFLAASASRPGLGASKDQQGICSMTRDGLNACKSSIGLPKPAVACCSSLSHANLTCLCGYKAYLPMLGIDPDQAVQLPAKCNITSPANC